MKSLKFLLLLTHLFLFTSAKKNPSIVIIGAGASGLAAGKKLLDNGFYNLTILEAESRIGGRINSVYFGDNYIDLGATFSPGEKGNIVYSMVKGLNLVAPSRSPKDVFHSSKGEVDAIFGKELMDVIKHVYHMFDDARNNETYEEYFTKHYNKVINEKFGTDKEKLKIAKDAITFVEWDILRNEGSPTWDLGVVNEDYIENEGNHYLYWKGKGFKTFLEIFLETYPNTKVSEVEKKVIFNKEIIKITYDVAKKWQGVTITCSDSTEYVADHVIVTTSLGVLKERLNTLFNPALSSVKKRAIEDIGFGLIMTVAMYYENKWWDSDCKRFQLIWSKEDMEKSYYEFPEGPHYNNRSWITYVSSLWRTDENPNVFIAWFAGVLIPEIELISDEIMTKGMHFITQKFLGHKFKVTRPDKIIHSKWRANPHFRGTYSYQTPAATKGNKSTNAEEDLAAPIKNSDGRPFVHFAGEATHAYYYSTVHGAVESGLREAGIIKEYYSND